MSKPPTCATCPAWHENKTDDGETTGVGSCHLLCPDSDGHGFAVWPRVIDDDWCSQHPDNPMSKRPRSPSPSG